MGQETFSVEVGVRSYETDANGHVNHAVYHHYGEHARMEHFRAAGCTPPLMVARGLTVIILETRARFLSELLLGEQVEVTSEMIFGDGKSFGIEHLVRRLRTADGEDAGGTVSCEISCRMGLLDTTTRRLVADPRGTVLAMATRPELIG
ncbi:MAG: acyl-CoA thioesterase [Pseudonocardia sp.]|nr:acyl-CoA thioesterase [Pseudonocardia sp.]